MPGVNYLSLLSVFLTVYLTIETCLADNDFLAITVATDETDGFRRFVNSAKKYKVPIKVLGMGQEWRGGDVQRFAGGGQKVRLLREELKQYKDNKDQILMFSDSYDAVFSAGAEEILKSFKRFDSRVVFSAEDFCWPDTSLADKYPQVKPNEKRYLNSGGIIGYAPEFYAIVTSSDIGDKDDDQLFYTKVFLNEKLRKQFSLKLDTRGEIFQNLNGALDDVQVKFKGSTSYMYNSKTGNIPHVIHGNGPIKVQFNGLTNYLTDNWTPSSGCQSCKQNTISLSGLPEDDYPSILLAIFIEHPTPFIKEFFQHLILLKYPKAKMDLFIHYADEFHTKDIGNFLELFEKEYHSAKVYGPGHDMNEWDARNKALVECEKKACQYYFAVNSNAQLENDATLIHLIESNRSIIAPLLLRPGKMWSNFWGALSATGFYKRSEDYVEIITGSKQGQWNVPYMTEVLLIHGYLIPKLHGGYKDQDLDTDMALCKRAREKGIFMYIDNQQYFGHLVNSENFETTHKHSDLFSLMDNRYTWEKKYLHPEYKTLLEPNVDIAQPCTDVFWFPLVTELFCWHLIEECEYYGTWSSGGHQDERLAGGYENVPTVDIHMNQIGFETQWLDLLQSYISPIAAKVFLGYFPESRAIMNFVVRYKPGEQDYLRPHHDTSTYSVNLALNRPKIDYEGGGTNFLRYNCKVTDSKQGWTLIHPGRVTHWHEGLKTTNGTRYIMVSFVDP